MQDGQDGSPKRSLDDLLNLNGGFSTFSGSNSPPTFNEDMFGEDDSFRRKKWDVKKNGAFSIPSLQDVCSFSYCITIHCIVCNYFPYNDCCCNPTPKEYITFQPNYF